MPEFVAHLANCPMVGEDITQFDDGSWVRNLIHLRLGRARLTLIQDRSLAKGRFSELVGKRMHTTDLVLSNVPVEKTRWAVNLAVDVSWLLSFATMSPVNLFQWSHGNKGEGWSARDAIQHFRPVVSAADGASIRNLVETCWKRYRALKRVRKLPEVIHYCVQTENPDQPIEYQLLGAFVMLENLKATYARSRSIPFVAGFFRKPSPPGTNPRRAATYSFKELLEMMFHDANMRPALRRLVDVRNEIVHFGLSRRTPGRLVDYYDRVHDLVREYLLRLLGFAGRFSRYSGRGRRTVELRA